MKAFISGGAKNGKTTLGQDLAVYLAAGEKHYYVATMISADAEDDALTAYVQEHQFPEIHAKSRGKVQTRTPQVICSKNCLK